MGDLWSRKVFLALLRRYEIRPYRYSGQRYTTVMPRVSKRFVDETLWPEFQEIAQTLESYLSDVTDRVIHEVIHKDSSEAELVREYEQLPPGMEREASASPVDTPPATDAAPGGPRAEAAEPDGSSSDQARGKKRKKRKRRKQRKRR
jgi:hypothetical protein